MEALKQIANVAGYSGLYRIIKPGRAGVIVETLDDKKTKTMMGATARVSVLNDISIYVTEGDGQSIPLSSVLLAVSEKYGDNLSIDSKAPTDELADFMASVVPDYDRERVRPTDIKKLISWYGLLRQFAPEVFSVATGTAEETESEKAPDEAVPADSPVAESQEDPKE